MPAPQIWIDFCMLDTQLAFMKHAAVLISAGLYCSMGEAELEIELNASTTRNYFLIRHTLGSDALRILLLPSKLFKLILLQATSYKL